MTDTFQWQRCDSAGANCVDIPGETAASYLLAADDVGRRIRVHGFRDTVDVGFSAASALVAASGGAPASVPFQGISVPLGNVMGKSSSDQDFFLDQLVSLGNGHDMFLRTDYFGGSQFSSLRSKVAARPSLHLLPILNYGPGSRPSRATFAAQAAALAAICPIVNLLNEPNLNGWTAADAAAWCSDAYDAIAGAAIVVGPSAGFNKGSGHDPANVLAWNQAYAAAGGQQDIGAVTCYGDAQFIDGTWNGWSVVPQIKSVLGGHLIVLEGGWHVTDGHSFTPFNRGTVTDEHYQSIAVQTGLAARAAGRVDSFLVYSLWNDAEPGGFGLLNSARAQREAYGTLHANAA